LAGFTGNSPFYFNGKFHEKNAAQVVDEARSQRLAPAALYVYVDALTTWGGSQFINSSAVGNYEDFLVLDVLPEVEKHFAVLQDRKFRAVVGGSSGGYGALHLASAHPHIFGIAAAIAPDSFFEVTLLNDLLSALPVWEKYRQSGFAVLESLRSGSLRKFKNFHSLLNAFAMSACYSPKGTQGDFDFPLIAESGRWKPEILEKWRSHDPLFFLPARSFFQKESHLFLEVGNRDQYHLQYGARQIHQLAIEAHLGHHYLEFDGTHFDIGERRIEVWKWLQELWPS